jgi:hypothetical protein
MMTLTMKEEKRLELIDADGVRIFIELRTADARKSVNDSSSSN